MKQKKMFHFVFVFDYDIFSSHHVVVFLFTVFDFQFLLSLFVSFLFLDSEQSKIYLLHNDDIFFQVLTSNIIFPKLSKQF